MTDIIDKAMIVQRAAEEQGIHIRFLAGTFEENGQKKYIKIGDKEWPHQRETLESLISYCQKLLAELE